MSLQNSFPRENEAVKQDLVEFKVQCSKVFCCHGNKSTILLFNSIFRTLLKFLLNFTLLSLIEVMAFFFQKSWFFGFQLLDFFSLFSLLNHDILKLVS